MKPFRIAVCFSGLARFLKKTFPRHDRFFCIENNVNVDRFLKKHGFDSIEYNYFFYFSNHIIPSELDQAELSNGNYVTLSEINNELLSLIKDNKKTKKYYIENNFEKLRKIVSEVKPDNLSNVEWQAYRKVHQFYSAEQSNILKKEYEIENNFKYDLCIRFRTDLFVFENCIDNIDHKLFTLENFIENKDNSFFALGEQTINSIYRIGDLSFYSSSECADKYYENLTESILKNAGLFFNDKNMYVPEEIWGYFLKEKKLNYKLSTFSLKLIKQHTPEFNQF